MKATKIRAYLVVPALAAVLGLSTYTASADHVSPAGNTSASSSNVTIKLGTATVTCTSSSAGFNAQDSASGQPVCGTIGPPAPTLTGCTVKASGFTFSASCTTSGSWSLCASSGGSSSLTIPPGGVVCTANILGQTCKATASSASSPGTTISGAWSNTSSSATFTNQSIPTTTSGGFPCPSGTSSSFSATYATSPALTITPN